MAWGIAAVLVSTYDGKAQLKPIHPSKVKIAVAASGQQSGEVPLPIANPDRYSQLLVKYLSHVKLVTDARDLEEIRGYRQMLAQLQDEDRQLIKKQSEVLISLRQLAKSRASKVLDFPDDEGESGAREYGALLPNSATSAQIFSTLIQEKLVNLDRLLDSLGAKCLSPQWIVVLQRLRDESPQDSTIHKKCLFLLGRAGINNPAINAELKNLILQHQNSEALDTLLFSFDVTTGMPRAKISHENLRLVKQLAVAHSTPEIQQICAQFCASVNDYDLAQIICLRLLNQKYDDTPVMDGSSKQASLFRARHRCLTLMFYGLQNEKMFKSVYERSEEISNEARTQINLPLVERTGYTFSTLGRLEVDFAASLVKSVEKW